MGTPSKLQKKAALRVDANLRTDDRTRAQFTGSRYGDYGGAGTQQARKLSLATELAARTRSENRGRRPRTGRGF